MVILFFSSLKWQMCHSFRTQTCIVVSFSLGPAITFTRTPKLAPHAHKLLLVDKRIAKKKKHISCVRASTSYEERVHFSLWIVFSRVFYRCVGRRFSESFYYKFQFHIFISVQVAIAISALTNYVAQINGKILKNIDSSNRICVNLKITIIHKQWN